MTLDPLTQQEPVMPQAKGEFDVKLQPLPVEDISADAMIGRRSINKVFRGALEATSEGQMVSIGTTTPGSAAYVAVERVTGTLDGKSGTFSLHHTGIMDRGKPSLEIRVVPDSGTDGLAGIRGSLAIDIAGGKHFYTFDYEL